MADLHHRPRSAPKTTKPLILLAIAGSVPNSFKHSALLGWVFSLVRGFDLPSTRISTSLHERRLFPARGGGSAYTRGLAFLHGAFDFPSPSYKTPRAQEHFTPSLLGAGFRRLPHRQHLGNVHDVQIVGRRVPPLERRPVDE